MENIGESAISWIDDDLIKGSTNTPEILVEEEMAIGTLVVIVISAILSITLLFLMAVFIDCRHQKLAKNKQKGARKIIKITLPSFISRNNVENEDQSTFADKMYTEHSNPSSSTVIV